MKTEQCTRSWRQNTGLQNQTVSMLMSPWSCWSKSTSYYLDWECRGRPLYIRHIRNFWVKVPYFVFLKFRIWTINDLVHFGDATNKLKLQVPFRNSCSKRYGKVIETPVSITFPRALFAKSVPSLSPTKEMSRSCQAWPASQTLKLSFELYRIESNRIDDLQRGGSIYKISG